MGQESSIPHRLRDPYRQKGKHDRSSPKNFHAISSPESGLPTAPVGPITR